MIIILILALILTSITVLLLALRSRGKNAAILPLDVAAFRTLVDRDDELFLRARLARKAFFQLKRARIRVTVKYVDRIAGNAAAVRRLSEFDRMSQDPEVARAAVQLTDVASQVRLQCLLAFAKLSVEFVFPTMQMTPALLASQYQSMRDSVLTLGVLQPQRSAALAAI